MKKYKSSLFSLLTFSILTLSCSKKNPTSAEPQLINVIWEKTYGGAGADYGRAVQQTSDGGYIIVGFSDSYGEGDYNYYMIKTDAQGEPLWQKIYGDEVGEYGCCVTETFDGGYVFGGYVDYSFYQGSGIYLAKADTGGNLEWTRRSSTAEDFYANAIIEVADGNLVVAGSLNGAMALQKINKHGELIWIETYQEDSSAYARAVDLSMDGGYIIAAMCLHSRQSMLVKTDANGKQKWMRHFCGAEGDIEFNDVMPTQDGGYIVVGSVLSGPRWYDAHIMKVNSSGDSLWIKTFGDIDRDEFLSVKKSPFGGFIAGGSSMLRYGYGWSAAFVLMTDRNGDSLGTLLYGDEGTEMCHDMQETSDGKYIIVGNTNSFGAGNNDILVCKISAP